MTSLKPALSATALSALACMALFAPIRPALADDSEVVATVRVLHQNIYGRDKKDCKERYRALARHILEANPPYDIVSLNEHWRTRIGDVVGETCDATVLTNALMEDPRYRDDDDRGIDRSRLSYPRGHFYQFDGGNSILTTLRIADFDSWKFSNTNNLPVAGYMRSQIEVAPGVLLDFWTTHFEAGSDGCHEGCHRTEIRDLGDEVAAAASDGHPVVIAGDLNVSGPLSAGGPVPDGGTPGYDFLMSSLAGPRDLWLEAHPRQDSPDEGYSYDPATNPIAASVDDSSRDRIDYLLAPVDPHFVRSAYSVRVQRMDIVRWTTPSGTNISDHYGLDTTLEITRPLLTLPSADSGGPLGGIIVHAR